MMERPRHQTKMLNTKMLVLLMAMIMVFGSVIGGTVAWLIAQPEPVVNTFTYGDIDITLTETDTGLDDDGDGNTNSYKMLPGENIKKDPVVTVEAGSEEMWLFVKLEKSANFVEFMTYAVDDSWAVLEGETDVYYRHITAEEIKEHNLIVHVLKEDTVTVLESVTKEQLNALDAEGASNYPTMTVTAYAIQHAGSATAADAWAKIEDAAVSTPGTEGNGTGN